MLQLLHRLMDVARVYRLAQLLGQPTIRRYRILVQKHVPRDPDRRVLEIGCGVGSSRTLFLGSYTGIDINPDYIRTARQTLDGKFYVMDAAQLSFDPNTFDDAVSIATGHHLSDEQLAAMISKATSIASNLHIIDAILPVATNARFKRTLFRMDRGQHVRTFEELRAIVMGNARVHLHEVLEGPLHDVCYLQVTGLPPAEVDTGIDRPDCAVGTPLLRSPAPAHAAEKGDGDARCAGYRAGAVPDRHVRG
jgi:SAM-dependent methyltransferase